MSLNSNSKVVPLSIPVHFKIHFVNKLVSLLADSYPEFSWGKMQISLIVGVATGFDSSLIPSDPVDSNKNTRLLSLSRSASKAVHNGEIQTVKFYNRVIYFMSPDVLHLTEYDFSESSISSLKDTRIGMHVMSCSNEGIKAIEFLGYDEIEKVMKIVLLINKIQDLRGVLSEVNRNSIRNQAWVLINSLSLRTVNKILGGENLLLSIL